MELDRRAFLALTVRGLGLVSLLAVAHPFIASLRPSAEAMNESLVSIKLPTLEPGIVNSVEVKGMKLFVLKPNEEQAAAIKRLDPYVADMTINSYRADIGAYVYWAHSSKWGCPLEHKPPQASRLREWRRNAKWLGGYWDPWCEVSYDYAGRTIKSYEFTFNGYTWPGQGLKTPTVFEKSGSDYVVSILQR